MLAGIDGILVFILLGFSFVGFIVGGRVAILDSIQLGSIAVGISVGDN